MIVVGIAIVAAVVLLPTLIGLLGHRVERAASPGASPVSCGARRSSRRRPGISRANGESTFWHRWTARVMHRPFVSIAASAGFLLFLTIPAFPMKMVPAPSTSSSPTTTSSWGRADERGDRRRDPMRVIADFEPAEPPARRARRARRPALDLAADPAVVSVAEWQISAAGSEALLDVFRAAPATRTRRLRSSSGPDRRPSPRARWSWTGRPRFRPAASRLGSSTSAS